MTGRHFIQWIERGLAVWLACFAVASAQPPEYRPTRPSPVVPASRETWDTPGSVAISDSNTSATTASRPLPRRGSEPTTRSTGNSSQTANMSLWGTVGALAVLAVGLTFFLKWIRRHGPAVLRALPNEAVEPMGQRVLSRGVAVHLVRCGNHMLLLGVGPDGVRTLADISDPAEVDLLTGACRRRDEGALGIAPFAQLLQRSPPSANNTPSRASAARRSSYETTTATEVDGV